MLCSLMNRIPAELFCGLGEILHENHFAEEQAKSFWVLIGKSRIEIKKI